MSEQEKYIVDASNTFHIAPSYLKWGLKAAAGRMPEEKFEAIMIGGLAWPQDTQYSPAALVPHPWIEKLILSVDLQPNRGEIRHLAQLTQLKKLGWKASEPFNYAGLQQLEALSITDGRSLAGLDQVRSLKSLEISFWKGAALPTETTHLAAERLMIRCSDELVDISALFKTTQAKHLYLGCLPKLQVKPEDLHLDSLESLELEEVRWSDLKHLHSHSLRKLSVRWMTIGSLGFLSQLPELEELEFDQCADRDMTPVLDHPALRKVSFPKGPRFSHTAEELNAALAEKGKKAQSHHRAFKLA